MADLNTGAMTPNTYARWDKLAIFRGKHKFYLALAGDKLKSVDKLPFDLDAVESDKETFLQHVKQADHKGDWHSMMLSEGLLTGKLY